MLRLGTELDSTTFDNFGIGIIRSAPTQHHCAFVYEGEDGNFHLSHLLTHKRFNGKDAWNPHYFWTIMAGMEATNRSFCAGWLAALANSPLEISYGFDDLGCSLVKQANGEYSFENLTPGKGLTCATFILVVLETIGFPLIKRKEWPERPDDASAQSDIHQMLKLYNLMPGPELDLLSNDIGSVRFRPVEISAACTVGSWPVSFKDASTIAEQILTELAELRFQVPS